MKILLSMYKAVMDTDHNPLQSLPSAQQFQIMTYLSFMWTAIFCAGAGAWVWFGELLVGHLLVALGVIITGWTFKTVSSSAKKAAPVATYRDHPRSDGTPRYDDVWGA
ncbi:MAG: hypothetical protein AB3N20_18560 [Rhizobiaceae bacterium]